MNEWISTKERLPELNNPYLVYGGHSWDISIKYWNPDCECWDGDDGDDYFCEPLEIEFWTAMPEKPRKNK